MTLPSVSHSTVAATAAGANSTALSPTGHDRVAPRAAAGRTSVLHAANEPLCRRLLEIVDLAQRRAAEAA